MAVISELIDAGLELKAQGKRDAAIEHFRQLRETYPENARIMFELAGTWAAFDVPEQALPLYQALLELPKSKALPARDMPRLYARLAATHFALRDYQEALAVVEEGLQLHPSYRPLRAFRIFSHYFSGREGNALIDALDLMLESLAPSRWDIMEAEIKAIVGELRDSVNRAEGAGIAADDLGEQTAAASAIADEPKSGGDAEHSDDVPDSHHEKSDSEGAAASVSGQIAVADATEPHQDFELEVQVKSSGRKSSRQRSQGRKGKQLGEKKVRINISASGDAEEVEINDADDDEGAAKVNIPIDFD